MMTLCLLAGCEKKKADRAETEISDELVNDFIADAAAGAIDADTVLLIAALDEADIPDNFSSAILADKAAFINDFNGVLSSGDAFLYRLIDKTHPLPDGYEPFDLVELGGADKAYLVSRAGLLLRQEAASSLEEMARAARADGVTLTASSTYRSYDYQVEVYNRNVREMGQEAADRVSARPGVSQHQSGLVIDFGSITNDFASTKAGIWMAQNAARFGWSLSFPQGYEEVTGYSWESWHYRYVGRPLAAFIDRWFGGIQQYALQFINVWVG